MLRLGGVKDLQTAAIRRLQRQFKSCCSQKQCRACHQNEVRALRNCNDLAAAPLALRSTLDDPWQVKQLLTTQSEAIHATSTAQGTRLNLGVAVVDDAGNTGERSELVRRL